MPFTYILAEPNPFNQQVNAVLRTDEKGVTSLIPMDPANSDYQAYLASLEEASDVTA